MKLNKKVRYLCLHCDKLFTGTSKTKWHRECNKTDIRPATIKEP